MNAHGAILVVDDTEYNRDMLARRLRREGHAVREAASGREALAIVEGERVDLVLLDVTMPEMDGLEVLSILRLGRSIADLPVIMVTARDSSEDVVAALALGANDYVAKPIDFPVLLARVRTQLALRSLSQLKDEFLAMASHDLKNPLGEILGAASVLEGMAAAGAPLSPDGVALLGLVRAGAWRMQGLVEDFLDGQALEDGQLVLEREPVALGELVHEALAANRVRAEAKGIAVSAEPDDGVWGDGDRRRLAQVVQNLLDNALKFCPAGSRVTLRTCRRDGLAVLEVADSGPGLTEADLGLVFQRYARLSNRPTGGEKSSGLGLAQCHQLMQAMGGRLAVRNAPEGGAIFWLELASVSAP